MTNNVYSVGQVNTYIKKIFTQDFLLNHIYVRGEISNCKYHSSGHIYFTLKDASGTLNAIMFAGSRKTGLSFPMKEGDKVIVLGAVRVYERDGKYQLYAESIVLEGAGLLYQRYEQLKQELADMGMFAQEYKRPIPRFPRIVGVVTAPTGAAVRDIQSISARRNPYVQLILYPAQVQGEGAAESIVDGIRTLEDYGVDVMIVGRGGGSIEDLWAFNEEIVARAIFECSVPIISAVGHETDTTIADYVADLRAPTPSAAAELAVYDMRSVLERLQTVGMQLNRIMVQRMEQTEGRLERLRLKLNLFSPQNQLLEKRQMLDSFDVRLWHAMERKFLSSKGLLENLSFQLEGVSPLKRLQGGCSFATDCNGNMIRSIREVRMGEVLRLRFVDGSLQVEVKDIIENDECRET